MSCLSPQVSVDSLQWDFQVSTLDDSNITDPPKVCTYIRVYMCMYVCVFISSELWLGQLVKCIHPKYLFTFKW